MILKLRVNKITVVPQSYFMINVELDGIENLEDVIKEIPIKDIIKLLGEDTLLDNIGIKKVKKHFHLKNDDDDFE